MKLINQMQIFLIPSVDDDYRTKTKMNIKLFFKATFKLPVITLCPEFLCPPNVRTQTSGAAFGF